MSAVTIKAEEDARRAKRQRKAPVTFKEEYDDMDSEQMELIRQAMENSRAENVHCDRKMEEAPVFRPTEEEFRDPIFYINSIKAQASPYGICRIIPPAAWNPKPQIDWECSRRFPTKLQRMNSMQEGRAMEDGKRYTVREYEAMAHEFRKNWILTHHGDSEPTLEELETAYWNLLKNVTDEDVQVEYANDLSSTIYGSGFERRQESDPELGIIAKDYLQSDFYRRSGWNLNNISAWPGSAIKYVDHAIDGVNRPWVYFGMLFSSFCWHREDINLPSINYMHCGASKQWYGVPSAKAKAFRATMKKVLRLRLKEVPDLEHHITTQICPSTLQSNSVPVYKTTQEAGQFVVTFPESYHGGFSYGFNCAEAVNFATADWIEHGAQSVADYRLKAKKEVFSFDRLLFTLTYHLHDLNRDCCTMLLNHLKQVYRDEEYFRRLLYSTGVQDLQGQAELPKEGKMSPFIGERLATYDDQRICTCCHHTCFLSAVCCNCSESAVACLKCCDFLCGCPRKNKFLLEWHSNQEIEQVIGQVEDHIRSLD